MMLKQQTVIPIEPPISSSLGFVVVSLGGGDWVHFCEYIVIKGVEPDRTPGRE